MTPKQIDTFCASLPAATRTVQWEGVIVFKVGGKMFCLIAPEDHSVGRISFKSAPEHYDALRRSPGFRPAPYLARAKWVSVDDPKALTDREMKAYLKRAHAVIAAALPKKKQARTGPLTGRRLRPLAAFDTSPRRPRTRFPRTRPNSIHSTCGKPMKVPVNSIRAGNVIEYNGKLWVASKVQHISPGKGGAFVAIEAKALREGNKLQERFRSGETIEHVHIDERDCTYLFKDDNGFTFMDKENYEQLTVGADVLDPDQSRWLQDGMEVTGLALRGHAGRRRAAQERRSSPSPRPMPW